jgi:hypothetical protein
MNPERNQLKRATEKLVKSLGGIEAAADILSKGVSTVGRWTTKHDRESINLIDLHELEANADEPLVTMTLARLAGGVFVPLPSASIDGAGLREKVIAIAEELGDVSQRVREALADEVMKPREADAVERELDDLIARASEAKLLVRAMAEAPRLKVAVNG